MKEKIISAALTVFDQKGFYQAGIREIAALASCSLPTLYYYFKNKEALFDTAVCDTYELITSQIEEQLPEGIPLLDRYYFAVLQRQMLEDEQRLAFRVTLKMQLGVDGFASARMRLGQWEENRLDKERLIILKEVDDEIFARVVLRVVDNMLQRSILFDERIPGDQIRQELGYLLGRP